MTRLKMKLRRCQPMVGSWLQINSPDVAEMMSNAGFEWLTIDMEHGAISVGDLPNLIRAIELGGAVPLVRISENDPFLIKRVLDAGAEGIIVPMVKSASEVGNAIRAAKYPPEGMRGVGYSRANRYGIGFGEYVNRINRDVMVIAQIEHIDAVRDVENIFSVKGLDGFIIGPYDLSGSMGKIGRLHDAEIQSAIRKTLRAGLAHKVAAGIHVIAPDVQEVRRRRKEGFRFIAVSTDAFMLGRCATEIVNSLEDKP